MIYRRNYKKTKIIIITAAFLCMILMLYLALAWYYRKGFCVNTWINGVYCTGKTADEVNSELLSKAKAPIVTITDQQGNSWELKPEAISYSCDYLKSLNQYLEKQNSLLWAVNCFTGRQHSVSPEVSYEEDALKHFWNELPFVQEEENNPAEITMEWTDCGYRLKDTTHNRLDCTKAYSLLKKILAEGGSRLDLAEEGCYRDISLTAEQEAVLRQWEKVLSFQSMELIYDMGEEQITLNGASLGQFLIRTEDGSFLEDENGELSVSRDKVDTFINELADTYDTYGKEREFQSTHGELVTVPGGTYGTLLDRKSEKNYLYEALSSRLEEVHTPFYLREAFHRGKNDIGDTYIEIDMTCQKMYFYKGGECLVETDIVTGNTGRRMGTPEGVNYVYAKQRNRTLRGPGYAAFVNFWMPVKGNIGIHDAGWRKAFGGEIYKKSGSHGCINTPYKAMKSIYEEVEIGTPVIMFYE